MQPRAAAAAKRARPAEADAGTEADTADRREAARLKRVAVQRGLLEPAAKPADAAADAARGGDEPAELRFPECPPEGLDVVNKAPTAAARTLLLALPLRLLPRRAGARLGTLSGLDRPNPSLAIDTLRGRLRLAGTFVRSPRRLIAATLAARRGERPALVTRGAHDSLLVFSDWTWEAAPPPPPGAEPPRPQDPPVAASAL